MLLTILRIILIIFAWLNLIEEKSERKSEKALWITIIVTTVVELVYNFFWNILTENMRSCDLTCLKMRSEMVPDALWKEYLR